MIIDKTNANKLNGIKMPKFKGHVKITLRNGKTGEIEKVQEGENLVTNAISDIFANNIMGGIDYSKMMPLYQKWFGGILLYEQAHTLNADNYYPSNDADNHVFAHAGDIAPSDISDDLTRGTPNTAIQVITENSIKLGWEWGSTQGNVPSGRVIRSLSLTHKDTGNVGLGSTSAAFQAFTPFEIISGSQMGAITTSLSGLNNVFTQYDDNHGLAFYIGTDGEYKAGKTKFSTTDISIQIKRLAYTKAGLFESTLPVETNMRKFTVSTSITFYMQPAYYFDYENKELWLFTNRTGLEGASNKYIQYTVIDCESEEETAHGTIESDTTNLAPIILDRTSVNTYNQPCFINIVKQGNYLYFPTTNMNISNWNWNNLASNSYNGFKKINITDTSDQEQVTFSALRYMITSGMTGGGLVIHDGNVTNGTTSYNCQYALPRYDGCESALLNEPENISSYVLPMGNNRASTPRYLIANKMVNTTLFNLDAPVQKTSSQSMQVEYTLTEVTS